MSPQVDADRVVFGEGADGPFVASPRVIRRSSARLITASAARCQTRRRAARMQMELAVVTAASAVPEALVRGGTWRAAGSVVGVIARRSLVASG